jgi:hypothetical protein
MARQFGLKAISAAAPSASAAASSAPAQRSGSVCVSKLLSLANASASTLAAQRAELPLTPASWRGSRGRRSISQH